MADVEDAQAFQTRKRAFAVQRARYEAKRLASIRWKLTAFLVATGAPVLALDRSQTPAIRHALAILTVLWLAAAVPMVGLLVLERRAQRQVEQLCEHDTHAIIKRERAE